MDNVITNQSVPLELFTVDPDLIAQGLISGEPVLFNLKGRRRLQRTGV